MRKHILFVCTGNTCRSPMAEHLLRHKAGDMFDVQSAGLAAFPGQDASPEVIQLFKERQIAMKHKSQSVTEALMDWSDLVLTMTERHRQMLIDRFPDRADQIHCLKAYVQTGDGNSGDYDIADPFGGNSATYARTFEEMERLITALIEKETEDEKDRAD